VKIHRTADDFLQDIVDWGERAVRHAASLTREQFMSDEKSQDAVSKCISNVGEAANKAVKLDPTIKEKFPAFEAEKAYAARNVISHDYFALDAAVLWATVKQSIPKFVADTRCIIEARKKEIIEKNSQ
jgi:uncharacterized protein with HEPN domain